MSWKHWRHMCVRASQTNGFSVDLNSLFGSTTKNKLKCCYRYNNVIMGAIASQITSLTIVYSICYSDAHKRKHQSSTSLAFVRWIHRRPVNSPYKWQVTRKMFSFDDVIMTLWSLCQRIPPMTKRQPWENGELFHLYYVITRNGFNKACYSNVDKENLTKIDINACIINNIRRI